MLGGRRRARTARGQVGGASSNDRLDAAPLQRRGGTGRGHSLGSPPGRRPAAGGGRMLNDRGGAARPLRLEVRQGRFGYIVPRSALAPRRARPYTGPARDESEDRAREQLGAT